MPVPYHVADDEATTFGWHDVWSGLGTGLVATVDAASLGVSGRVFDYLGYSWYDAKRREPGFTASRITSALGLAVLSVAGTGLAAARAAKAVVAGRTAALPWRYAPLNPGVLGETCQFTGDILIQRGLVGRDFVETLAHEGVHSIVTRRTPRFLRSLAAWSYDRGGMHMLGEEFLAELAATNNLAGSLLLPLGPAYCSRSALVGDLVLGRLAWSVRGRVTSWLDDHIPPPITCAVNDWTPPVATSPHLGPRLEDISTPSLLARPAYVRAPAPHGDAPPAKPMDTVRDLFASRLTDAGRGLFGTQFGIDGVAVELTEGSPIARVEFDSLLLADGPEMRDGHMALTRADAQAIERRVNQVLADWSVHRRFGSRITASRAAGDEAQLTMDGFQVVLRHDRPEATIAGQPVVITPAPRRALGNMTLAPSAFIALEQALSSARRAAQPPTSAWPDEPAISPPEGSLFSRHRSGLFGGQATSDFGLKPFGTTF